MTAEYLAGLTGGIFLCHVLFINLVRSGLGGAGLTPHLGWAGMVAVTFTLTMGCAALFTALMLRTPLRWVLTGPVRAEQRARLGRAELTASRRSRHPSPWSSRRAYRRASDAPEGPSRSTVTYSALSQEALIVSLHFLMKFFPRSQYRLRTSGHCEER